MPAKTRLPASTGFDALKWRCIGPSRGGRVVAVSGDPVNKMVFYFGACAGGIWKTVDGGVFWQCVSDGFMGSAARRLDRGRALGPQRDLCRHRRDGDPPRRLLRRRPVQVDRCRPHLEQCRLEEQQVHRPHLHPPAGSRSRLCRGPGRCVRSQRGARRLSLPGRRQELAEDPAPQRRGGRDRSLHGPHQSAHPVRLDVGSAAQLLEHIERRPGQRAVPQHRRRRHVAGDLAQSRPAGRPAGQDRRVDFSRPRRPRLGAGRGRGRQDRPLPLRRPRRALDPGLGQSRPDAPALVLHARLRRPRPRRHGLRHQSADVEVDRRRHELQRDHHPPRRQSRPVDRPQRSQPHDRGQRRRRPRVVQFRRVVVDDLQSEDGAVLSSRHRQPVSLPRLRHAAGQHLDLRPERCGMGRDHAGRLLLSRHRRERLHRRQSRATTTSSMSAPSARVPAARARCSATITARARSSWSMCGPRNRRASRPRT